MGLLNKKLPGPSLFCEVGNPPSLLFGPKETLSWYFSTLPQDNNANPQQFIAKIFL